MLLRKNSRALSIKSFQHEMKSERDRINELLLTERFLIFFPPWVMEISICTRNSWKFISG